jgi:hypothetical protein
MLDALDSDLEVEHFAICGLSGFLRDDPVFSGRHGLEVVERVVCSVHRHGLEVEGCDRHFRKGPVAASIQPT